MLRALYTAGTGMLTQMKHMDVTGNNMSNSNTGGYKADRAVSVSFEDMLVKRTNDNGKSGQSPVVGPLNTGIYMDEVVTQHSQGPLEQTGKSTDLAIQGGGFFTVETQDGPRYTRGGSFFIDSEGYMTIDDGYRLMGKNGTVQPGTENITVNPYGDVYADNVYLDTLQMVSFPDTTQLVKEGSLLFQNNGAAAGEFAGEVAQGYLEGSNVDLTSELTQMMSFIQNYNSNQRIIRMLDETLAKTVNEVGRI
jgi:flagellar basal-body rod protein FlgG